ncbi:hypothetical protein NPIL_530411 [Nephila pilipes]|uniref:Uncharacterized protein n=1 Tax=Nephila pilipes TaxID=299642 RepID=A0A8X6MQZ8_NEPPI|nr:hypothetical protein NPIL_530411 [Nephila pilipes]
MDIASLLVKTPSRPPSLRQETREEGRPCRGLSSQTILKVEPYCKLRVLNGACVFGLTSARRLQRGPFPNKFPGVTRSCIFGILSPGFFSPHGEGIRGSKNPSFSLRISYTPLLFVQCMRIGIDAIVRFIQYFQKWYVF